MRYSNVNFTFLLIFQGDPQFVTANTTKIYLNEALHYPSGFSVVAVSSAGPSTVTWSHVSTNHIEVVHNPEMVKKGTVTVAISRN